MEPPDPVRAALQAGWRRSLQASSPGATVPWQGRVWRRYRWWIVSGLLFLLGELMLFALGGSVGSHF
jgi:hypothetical protein